MKKNFLFLLVMFLFIFLSACSTLQEQQISPTEINVEIPTETLQPTPTFTEVPTSTPTLTPSPTETMIPTATLTPTEVVNFDSVRIIGSDDLGGYASVIFEFPGVKKAYRVTINGSEYKCTIAEGVSDRLFCTGNVLRLDDYVTVKFFLPEETDDALFASEIYVPKPYETPLPLGDPSTWCPERGQNISCETEHRVENGEECWVSTCTDACGYYYSYHTCQLPPHNNFLSP